MLLNADLYSPTVTRRTLYNALSEIHNNKVNIINQLINQLIKYLMRIQKLMDRDQKLK